MAILGCLVDMMVAIAGDGITELPKHMFLANLMFDFALIASAGAGLALCLRAPRIAAIWSKVFDPSPVIGQPILSGPLPIAESVAK